VIGAALAPNMRLRSSPEMVRAAIRRLQRLVPLATVVSGANSKPPNHQSEEGPEEKD